MRGFSVVFHIFVAIDAAVKEVVDALKNKADKYTDGTSMYDNTYIVFTSDNGGSNDNGASTYPLKGSKGSFFEGGEMSCQLLYLLWSNALLKLKDGKTGTYGEYSSSA